MKTERGNLVISVLIGVLMASLLGFTVDQILNKVYIDGASPALRVTVTGGVPASSVTVGTTTISGGTNNQLLYDNSGVLGERANPLAITYGGTGATSLTGSRCLQTNAGGTAIEVASGACGTGAGTVTGTGTTGLIPDWTSATALGDSLAYRISVTNDTVTGTTVNKLTKFTSAGKAIITSAAETSGVLGIVHSGAGTSGSAVMTTLGAETCVSDNATTAGHYATVSASVAGDCSDTGSATFPTAGTQVIGIWTETGVAGSRTMFFNTPDVASASSGGGGGGAKNPGGAAGDVQYRATGNNFAAEAAFNYNSTTNKLALGGTSSGVVTLATQAAAGTWEWDWPTSAGSSGQPLLSGGGAGTAMTWGTLGVGAGGTGITSGTSGGIPYYSATSTIASSALLGAGNVVYGGGAGTAPAAESNFTYDATNNRLSMTGLTAAADNSQKMVTFSGTLPAVPTSGNSVGTIDLITSAGSTAGQSDVAHISVLLAGYTGSAATYGLWGENDTSGTGVELGLGASGVFTQAFNAGSYGLATQSGSGYSVGMFGNADSSTGANIGVYGRGTGTAAGTNIGGLFSGTRSTEGTNLKNIGAVATIATTDPATIADNVSVGLISFSDGTGDIFRGYSTTTKNFSITAAGNTATAGTITSSRTTDIGWSVQSAANQACNTTCTSACVFGTDSVTGGILACTDATADVCLCAGSS